MPDDIVVAAVADSSGVLVSIINNPVVGTVIEQLLNTGSIDFLVDHKKTFAANPKTQEYVARKARKTLFTLHCHGRGGVMEGRRERCEGGWQVNAILMDVQSYDSVHRGR